MIQEPAHRPAMGKAPHVRSVTQPFAHSWWSGHLEFSTPGAAWDTATPWLIYAHQARASRPCPKKKSDTCNQGHMENPWCVCVCSLHTKGERLTAFRSKAHLVCRWLSPKWGFRKRTFTPPPSFRYFHLGGLQTTWHFCERLFWMKRRSSRAHAKKGAP